MKAHLLVIVPITLLFCSCQSKIKQGSGEKWKQEVFEAERRFAEMAGQEGISAAFIYYAADDAVIMRHNKVYTGKSELMNYFDSQLSAPKDEKLSWKPDFVDVSSSGDLAYTYGPFVYSYKDSSGNKVESRGIFHTVWKRQADGSWRFVWD